MIRARWCIVFFAGACLLVSCKPKVPKGIMEEQMMEDVLYDYHLAKAMASRSSDSVAYKQRLYIDAVFQKYHINQASFDSSLIWYTRHTAQLFKIYERLNERYDKKALILGASTSSVSTYASLSTQGDTANIWKDRSFYLLVPDGVNNRMSFTMKADTSYHPSDRFMWHFTSTFIYREGRKQATALLLIRYVNDSVVCSSREIYGGGDISLEVTAGDKHKIKNISGFVYLNEPYCKSGKLMILSQISLVRFHANKNVENAKAAVDTLNNNATIVEIPDTARLKKMQEERNKRDSFMNIEPAVSDIRRRYPNKH